MCQPAAPAAPLPCTASSAAIPLSAPLSPHMLPAAITGLQGMPHTVATTRHRAPSYLLQLQPWTSPRLRAADEDRPLMWGSERGQLHHGPLHLLCPVGRAGAATQVHTAQMLTLLSTAAAGVCGAALLSMPWCQSGCLASQLSIAACWWWCC